MAGIGQRFTSADHSVPWNTQSHFTMGRAMMHDCSKPITTYNNNFVKRPLFGTGTASNTGAATFSDIANLTSRPGSSQHNGEILNSLPSGFSVRTPYPATPESGFENGHYINALSYNGTQNGPQRNFSESSLFPLSTVSRTAGNDLGPSRVVFGNTTPSLPISTAMSLSRNTSNAFSSSLGNDTGSAVPSNSNLTSSRGVTLDPSEFPPILNSVGRSGTNLNSTLYNSSASKPPLRNYISIMSKGSPALDATLSQVNQFGHHGSSQSNPLEFSKQDFPALPGAHQVTASVTGFTTSGTCTLTVSSMSTPRRSLSTTLATPTPTVNVAPNSRRAFGSTGVQLETNTSKSSGSSNSIQLLPNHLVTNIPKNMIYDQFGMLGLLKLIRVGDYDATLNMLAPGLDLSSLHSNWQTPGELHATFVSPCHDSCIGRPQDMDYHVPPEYLIRHLVIGHLPDPTMNQLSEETLFWLFYNCCREESQLVVAKELYQREWRFHKKEQIWLTRIMGAQFTTDNNSEQGDYYFWDPLKAQKSTHQMTILYSDLDNAPAAFRLSSSTLSAFTTIDLPGSSQGGTSQHQSQQQQQQPYPHQPSAMLNNNTSNTNNNNNSNNNNSCQLIPMTANTLTSGTTVGSGPIATSNNANLTGLFNTRPTVQPPIKQQQHNSNCLTLSHTVGRANTGHLNSLFVPRSVPAASPANGSVSAVVTSSTATTAVTPITAKGSSNSAAITSTVMKSNNNSNSGGSSLITTTTTTDPSIVTRNCSNSNFA